MRAEHRAHLVTESAGAFAVVDANADLAPLNGFGAPTPISDCLLHSLDLPHINPRPQRAELDIEIALLVRRRDRFTRGWHIDQEHLVACADLRERRASSPLLAFRHLLSGFLGL